MKKLQEIVSKKEVRKLKKSAVPGFIPPMLATLTDDYFDDPAWIYERKLDGVRCLVVVKKGKVTLYSRNRNDISAVYPEIKAALERSVQHDLIADGEIVAFKGKVTSFSTLQNRMQLKDPGKVSRSGVKVFLYLFDLPFFEGYDLTDLPLKERKKILRNGLNWQDPIRYTSHRNETGKEYLQSACEKGWEGIIAKNGSSPYVNSRNRNWLKFKCSLGQELVIGGFSEPQGERTGFGALLVGYYQGDSLQYAGKVGTGFDDEFLNEWRKKFDRIQRKSSPFENFSDTKKGTNHWLEPKYVGQFGFTEWTKTNKLRHPRFLGMRSDKDPKTVVKEVPK